MCLEVSKSGGKPILLLTDGDIKRAFLLAKQTVYKASPFILRRLRIEKVPSTYSNAGGTKDQDKRDRLGVAPRRTPRLPGHLFKIPKKAPWVTSKNHCTHYLD